MWKTAWILARKDLKLYARDRTGLLLSLLLPIFLATIFAAAMGGMGGDSGISRVKLLVEDLDRTPQSQALVAELERSQGLHIEKKPDVRKEIAGGKAPAALLIPSGYGADVAADRAPQLKLYRDPSQTIEQQVIAGNLLPALFKASGSHVSRGMVKRSLAAFGFPIDTWPAAQQIFDQTWDSMHALAETSAASAGDGDRPAEPEAAPQDAGSAKAGFDFAETVPSLFGVDVENVAGGKDASEKAAMQSHAVSGIAVMMLLFGLVACGGSLLEEKTEGTLQRLQLTPAPGASILLGKFVYTLIAGMIQLVVLFTYGGLLFDVPVLRDPAALILVSLALACAATGMGIFLAVTCRTRKQLEGLATLIILVMSALGGSWFPLIITPAWYQRLGHFTLNAWAMDAYQGIFWYGKGLSGIWLEILVLFAIAVVTTLLALRGWKRRFEVLG